MTERVGQSVASPEHVHRWQPNGLVRERRESCSPCSRLDDVLYDAVFSITVCECGATRKKHVANENSRRRGDDLRRQR